MKKEKLPSSNIDDVENTFGIGFKKYCDSRNIVPKKVNKAFEVTSIQTLHECLNVLQSHRYDMDTSLRKIQNKVIKKTKIEPFINKEIFITEMVKKRMNSDQRKLNEQLNKMKLKIYLNDTTQTIPTKLPQDMSGVSVLSTTNSGKEVFHTFQKYVKKEHHPTLESLSPKLHEVLEHFRRQHRKFNYYSCLRGIMKKSQKIKKAVDLDRLNRPDMPTVNKEELKSFLAIIFRKVVPKKFFGTVKNRRTIVNSLFQFIDIPSNISLNLGYYARCLKIKDIPWLKPIENESNNRSIFAYMLLWFFKEFIIKVLHSQVIIITRENDRVFVRRYDWHKLYKKFLRKQLEKKVLLNYVYAKGWKPPKVYYKLIPDVQYNIFVMRETVKKVRPVVTFRYSGMQKSDTYIIHTFLRQLYALKFGSHTLSEQWKSLIDNFSGKELYIVSTDVRNAFGSILLDKLFQLIVSLSKNLPEMLDLVYIARKSRTNYHEKTISFRQVFSDEDLPLAFSSRTLFARTNEIEPLEISKDWILRRIRKYIFHQRVFIGSKIYLVGRGISQGTMISPILSDIYYASILRKSVEYALSSCKLIRYVDDVVFVSTSETSAKRFLKITKTGIRKYGCFFKNKTVTNLTIAPLKQQSVHLAFIGLMIDSKNLELLPDFQDTKQQYSPFRANCLRNIQFLTERLKDPFCIRLPVITLDYHINSVNTIKSNLSEAFKHHAKYILNILESSFTKTITCDIAARLINLIMICNKKKMRRIVRLILGDKMRVRLQRAEKWIRSILKIFLVSYKPVFDYIKSITEVPTVLLD